MDKNIENLNNIKPSSMRKRILTLALPAIGEQIMKMMMGVFDTAMLGRLGPEPLAVSGLSWSILFFFMMLHFGMNVGVTAVVARYVGAGDEKSTSHAASQALLMNIVFSILITIIVFVFGESFFHILGAEPSVVKSGARFLRILSSTYVFTGLMFGTTEVIKAAGDTKTPMKIWIVVNLVTLFFDYGLVFGKFGLPRHGVMGSAEATACVRLIAAFLSFGGLMMGWYRVKVKFADIFKPDFEMILKILKVGGPSLMENMFYSTAMVVFDWIVTGLGTIAIAANSILFTSESLSYMPGLGFSIAAQILVAQALGEKDKNKARIIASETAKIGALMMGMMGLIFFLLPHFIVSLFTNSPPVIEMAAPALKIIALIQPIEGLMFVLLGVLKGAGDTKTTMKVSLVGMWLLRVPFAYIFAVKLGIGVLGAWGGMFMDIAFRAYRYYKRFKGGRWISLNI